MKQNFLKSGHLPSLIAAFLYFDISFMVWVLLGLLAVQIARDLFLDAAQKGLMVATPVLAGAVFRVIAGIMVGQLKSKQAGIVLQSLVIVGLLAAWLYHDINQQGFLFGVFTAVALFIACTGLFALSASTVAQRTKEIGIRKVLGAGSGSILHLLMWEFAKPVIGANLIAWPLAYYVMNRWLSGFAYHVDLAPSTFIAAGTLAFIIALATVSAQVMLAAKSRPVDALRYE